MFRRFFESQFRSIGYKHASFLLAFFALMSYVMGFVRDLLVAYYFGAQSVTDAYYSAYVVPDMIYTITAAGVLGGVFMPMLSKIKKQSEESYLDYLSAFLFFNTVMTGVLAVAAYVFMPQLMGLMLAKADVETLNQTIYLSRLLLWSPILFCLANTLSSFLMSNKHYFSYSLGPVLYNVGVIFSLVMFGPTIGIVSAIYGVIAGLVLMLAVRIWDFKSLGFKLKFRYWHKEIPASLKLSIYKVLSILTIQLSLMSFNYVAYGLAEGSLSAFNYAKNIQSFAVSLFGIAISQAVFPFLIDHRVDENKSELNSMIQKTFYKILFFVWPASVGLFLISKDLVQVLFVRGAFDADDLMLTTSVLMVLSLSIVFESVNHLLSRVYYAFLDTLRPVLIALVFLAANVFSAIYLSNQFGVAAFGFGFVVGSFLQFLGLLYYLKSFGLIRKFVFSLDVLKILLSGFLMGLLVYSVSLMSFNVVNSLVLQLLVGVLSYFVFTVFFKVFRVADINFIKFLSKKV